MKKFYEIEWSLLEVKDKKVVFTKKTQGWAEVVNRVEGGGTTLTNGALTMALHNLLADPAFARSMQ